MCGLGGNSNGCGCIYALDVDADYSATSFKPLVCGKPQLQDDNTYGLPLIIYHSVSIGYNTALGP